MEIIEAIETRDRDLASVSVREHCMALSEHIKQTWSISD